MHNRYLLENLNVTQAEEREPHAMGWLSFYEPSLYVIQGRIRGGKGNVAVPAPPPSLPNIFFYQVLTPKFEKMEGGKLGENEKTEGRIGKM